MATEAQTAFFSYSRDDSKFALRLAEDLKAAGANVWLDQLDLVGGQRWAEAVQEALEKCPRVLAILSPSAVASPNVMDEVTFALDETKTVIPVLHRDCKVPYRLRPLHRIDFRTDYARGVTALLRALGVEQQAVGAGASAASVVAKDSHGRPNKARREQHPWLFGAVTVAVLLSGWVTEVLSIIASAYADFRGAWLVYPLVGSFVACLAGFAARKIVPINNIGRRLILCFAWILGWSKAAHFTVNHSLLGTVAAACLFVTLQSLHILVKGPERSKE